MVQTLSRLIRVGGCINCRLSLLRAFIAVSSVSSHPRLGNSPRYLKQIRHSSSSPQQYPVSSEINKNEGSLTGEEEARGKVLGDKKASWTGLPWYLQVESPLKSSRPLSERQRIPDLPDPSPGILQPLLQQLSIDLGLDDLALLDLRELDPPPALGANLIMIIGTARSEKHLHVSADRLCRWLRSDYNLLPDADGLLGRNELKLKMRRKNKRAKLLGSGSSNDDGDDGVRTGWVCVKFSMVESPTALEGSPSQIEGFVGFGKQTERVKIVVQLLVEEKREELNLEKLWSGILKRRTFAETELPDESTHAAEEESDFNHSGPLAPAVRLPGSNSAHSTTTFSPSSIQTRGFHTGSRFFIPIAEVAPLTDPSIRPSSTQDQTIYTNVASVHEQVMLLLNSGKPMRYDQARRLTMAHRFTVAELQNSRWRVYFLGRLRSYVDSAPLHVVSELIGNSPEDRSSSSFLRCFYQTVSPFPSPVEWEFKVWLHCLARRLGHRAYTTEVFLNFFDDLQLSGATISNKIYMQLLRSALRPIPSAVNKRPDDAQQELAVKILQDMYDRTGNILTEDVFAALQESLAVIPKPNAKFLSKLSTPPNANITTCDLPIPSSTNIRDVQTRVTALMSTFHIRILNNGNRLRLMNIYAKQYKWVEFWRLWRSIAREGEARSPALWARMFRLVALTGHQKGCMNVLRTWIPDMDREEPKVKLEGELLLAVEACLQVADPSINMEKINDPEAKGEWIKLWRRCLEISESP